MLITKMLLKKQLDRLTQEIEYLKSEMASTPMSEADDISEQIERKFRQIQGFRLTLSYSDSDQNAENFQDLHLALHQMKVEFRLIRRKWKLLLTTDSRFRKIQQRKEYHAPTFAA